MVWSGGFGKPSAERSESDLPSRLQAVLDLMSVHAASDPRPQAAMDGLMGELGRCFALRTTVHLALAGWRLWVDGAPSAENRAVAAGLCRAMAWRGIREVILQRDVTMRELRELFALLREPPARLEGLGGACMVFRGMQAPHIQLVGQEPESGSERRLPPVPSRPTPTQEGRLEAELGHGFLDRSPEIRLALLREMLEGAFLEPFFQALEVLLAALHGTDPAHRDAVLETILTLIGEEAERLPQGALATLAEGLMAAEGADLAARETALAQILGMLGAGGELAVLQRLLERLRSPACASGLRDRVLGAPDLAVPFLQAYALEGRRALEGRILPCFRLLGEPAGFALTALLAREPSRPQRIRILELLKALAPESLAALRASLAQGPWYLLRNSLQLLGELEDAMAFDAVARCLEHSDVRVRRAALRAFWRTGGPWAEIGLLDLLPRSDPETQAEILLGLGQIQSVGAIPAIGALASTAPEPLRIQALEALGRIAHPGAVAILQEHLRCRGRIFRRKATPEERLAAARALVTIGTAEAWEAVERAARIEPRGPSREILVALVLARGTHRSGGGPPTTSR